MPEDRFELEEKHSKKKLWGYIFAACLVICFYFLLKNTRDVSATVDHVITSLFLWDS